LIVDTVGLWLYGELTAQYQQQLAVIPTSFMGAGWSLYTAAKKNTVEIPELKKKIQQSSGPSVVLGEQKVSTNSQSH